MNVAAIPQELRDVDRWVVWKAEVRDGKTTKVPFRADGAGPASSTNPKMWTSFDVEVAFATMNEAYGIGFVLTINDPFVALDLDKVLNDGALNGSELAGATLGTWVAALNTYTEISPSGTGLRIIGRGRFPENGRKKGNVEAYSAERFLTITGDVFRGLGVLRDVPQELLDAFHRAAFPPKADPNLVAIASRSAPVTIDDRELLERAMAARNGAAFRDLWEGRWEHRYSSQSEADLALCSMLAFWTGNDPARIDRLFRASELYRDKWEHGPTTGEDDRTCARRGDIRPVREFASRAGRGWDAIRVRHVGEGGNRDRVPASRRSRDAGRDAALLRRHR